MSSCVRFVLFLISGNGCAELEESVADYSTDTDRMPSRIHISLWEWELILLKICDKLNSFVILMLIQQQEECKYHLTLIYFDVLQKQAQGKQINKKNTYETSHQLAMVLNVMLSSQVFQKYSRISKFSPEIHLSKDLLFPLSCVLPNI